jgi:serine/threonine-protein kinase RsbW
MSAPIGTLRVQGNDLCEAVLVRVLGALAALADLPVDRLSDAQIMAGAIADRAPDLSLDGALEVTLAYEPSVIRFTLGSLVPGGATRLLERTAVPGVGPVIERMADEVRLETGESGDRLAVVVGRAPATA